jgi:hypothetical protein
MVASPSSPEILKITARRSRNSGGIVEFMAYPPAPVASAIDKLLYLIVHVVAVPRLRFDESSVAGFA